MATSLDTFNLKFKLLEERLPLELSRMVFSNLSKEDIINFNEKVPNHLRIIKKLESSHEDKKFHAKLELFKLRLCYDEILDKLDTFEKLDKKCLEIYLAFVKKNKDFLLLDTDCQYELTENFEHFEHFIDVATDLSHEEKSYYYQLLWDILSFDDRYDDFDDRYDDDPGGTAYSRMEYLSRQQD